MSDIEAEPTGIEIEEMNPADRLRLIRDIGPDMILGDMDYRARFGGRWHPTSIIRVLHALGLPTRIVRDDLQQPEPAAGIDQWALYDELRIQVAAGAFDKISVK